MFDNYNDLITIEELCEILAIGRNMAYKLLQAGEIKAFRIGKLWKIPKISLEQYILDQTSNVEPQSHKKRVVQFKK